MTAPYSPTAGETIRLSKHTAQHAVPLPGLPVRSRTTQVSYMLAERPMRISLALLFTILGGTAVSGQSLPLHPVPRFPMASSSLRIMHPAELTKSFTVAGESGAVLGQQDGTFEAWLFPVKVLSAFRI